jgi:hypothetical protein
MLFSLLYFLVRRLLGARGRRSDEKDIELLVLRHQVKVLQRQVKRPRLDRLDRVLLAAASRAMTRSRWSSFVVRPETLLRWHPRTRQEEVDTQEDGSPRPAADRPQRQGSRRPARPGEPTLGVPADPRGAAEARDQDLRDDGPDDPAPRRARPSSPPGRPNMDRVPAVTGGGDPRDRLLHRRDDQAQDDLRPVLHRALDPPRAPRRRHRPPRLGVGHPAGEEPRHRRAAVGCSVPPARPRHQVLGTVRCGAPRRGRPGHPNADPGTSGECIRRAVCEDRAPRVPRPRPDLRSSAPRASARGVRRALRGGETTSGTALGRARR